MMQRPRLTFSHFGIYVTDPAAMTAFYTRFFGFLVTDRGQLDTASGRVELVFLSADPGEHHQLVLCSGRPAELDFNTVNQLSFRVAGLAELRQLYEALQAEPVSEIIPVTHGNAVSVYFRDPEGNRAELFFDTPWYVTQPIREPLDFALDDAELMQVVENHARSLPGFMPVEQWRAGIATRLPSNR